MLKKETLRDTKALWRPMWPQEAKERLRMTVLFFQRSEDCREMLRRSFKIKPWLIRFQNSPLPAKILGRMRHGPSQVKKR